MNFLLLNFIHEKCKSSIISRGIDVDVVFSLPTFANAKAYLLRAGVLAHRLALRALLVLSFLLSLAEYDQRR